jgi:hypothetical protein
MRSSPRKMNTGAHSLALTKCYVRVPLIFRNSLSTTRLSASAPLKEPTWAAWPHAMPPIIYRPGVALNTFM